jgi:hypothetical protein
MKIKFYLFLAAFCAIYGPSTLAACSETFASSNSNCYSQSNSKNCQCSDPYCKQAVNDPCSSSNQCCEAFGNIGQI